MAALSCECSNWLCAFVGVQPTQREKRQRKGRGEGGVFAQRPEQPRTSITEPLSALVQLGVLVSVVTASTHPRWRKAMGTCFGRSVASLGAQLVWLPPMYRFMVPNYPSQAHFAPHFSTITSMGAFQRRLIYGRGRVCFAGRDGAAGMGRGEGR